MRKVYEKQLSIPHFRIHEENECWNIVIHFQFLILGYGLGLGLRGWLLAARLSIPHFRIRG